MRCTDSWNVLCSDVLHIRKEKDPGLSYLWSCVWSVWFQVGPRVRGMRFAVTLSPCAWCRTRLMMSEVNPPFLSLPLNPWSVCASLFPQLLPLSLLPPSGSFHISSPLPAHPHYHHDCCSLIRTEYLIRCHSSSL
jgi:hypothetical protein